MKINLERRLNLTSAWGAIGGANSLIMGYVLDAPVLTGFGAGMLTTDIAFNIARFYKSRENSNETREGETEYNDS